MAYSIIDFSSDAFASRHAQLVEHLQNADALIPCIVAGPDGWLVSDHGAGGSFTVDYPADAKPAERNRTLCQRISGVNVDVTHVIREDGYWRVFHA